MSYNVEWPNAEYHEILPNLYLGGHLWEDEGFKVDARDSDIANDPSWNYVVSAFMDFSAQSKMCLPRCDMRLVLFDDTESGLSDDIWGMIKSAVDEVVSRWRAGQKVLIRCQAGYNRSGLLMALVLMRLGLDADRAIRHLRWLRGKDVLVNQTFEGYVREREQEYLDEDAWYFTETLMGQTSD